MVTSVPYSLIYLLQADDLVMLCLKHANMQQMTQNFVLAWKKFYLKMPNEFHKI
jgi:hypothetical protein